MKRHRITRSVLVTGVLVTMCTACTGSGSGGSAGPAVPTFTSSVPSAPAPSSVPSPSGPASESPPALTGAPADPAEPADPSECRSNELQLSIGQGNAGAGTVYRPLRFTNSGGRTCVIQGFPGVSYVAGDDGHQVGPAAFRVGSKGGPISLAPGATANASVGFVQVRNFDPAVCRPTEVRGLRVYPPHETAAKFVPMDGTGCAGNPPDHQLVVKTVEAGPGA